jgi:hypothetical protein
MEDEETLRVCGDDDLADEYGQDPILKDHAPLTKRIKWTLNRWLYNAVPRSIRARLAERRADRNIARLRAELERGPICEIDDFPLPTIPIPPDPPISPDGRRGHGQ